MPTSDLQPTTPAKMVEREHTHLLERVTVSLKVVQIKFIVRRLTDSLRVAMTNARDTNSPPELREHYNAQQHLIADLIVTLQNALDDKQEPTHERPTD